MNTTVLPHVFVKTRNQNEREFTCGRLRAGRTAASDHVEPRNCKLSFPSSQSPVSIEPGTFADYKSLARFHYKGSRPGAITSIFRLRHDAPTVVGRFLNRSDESQTVGVLVRSLPQLACQLRDIAIHHRYSGMKQREAAVMLNREVRTISRVIIDPQWRGMGLAVNLVRHALANPEPGTIFTEALAAMGRVSPFFEHAGMIRYDRPPRLEHARLSDALWHVGIQPFELASSQHVDAALIDAASRQFLLHELRRWHRAAHRTPRATLEEMTLQQLLRAARDELLTQPVYFLCRHDLGTKPCDPTTSRCSTSPGF